MLIKFALWIGAFQAVYDILLEFREYFLRYGVDIILLHGVTTHGSDSLDCLVAKWLLHLLCQLLFVVHDEVFYQTHQILIDDVQIGGCAWWSLQYIFHLELLTLSSLGKKLVFLLEKFGLFVFKSCKILSKSRYYDSREWQLYGISVYSDAW